MGCLILGWWDYNYLSKDLLCCMLCQLRLSSPPQPTWSLAGAIVGCTAQNEVSPWCSDGSHGCHRWLQSRFRTTALGPEIIWVIKLHPRKFDVRGVKFERRNDDGNQVVDPNGILKCLTELPRLREHIWQCSNDEPLYSIIEYNYWVISSKMIYCSHCP